MWALFNCDQQLAKTQKKWHNTRMHTISSGPLRMILSRAILTSRFLQLSHVRLFQPKDILTLASAFLPPQSLVQLRTSPAKRYTAHNVPQAPVTRCSFSLLATQQRYISNVTLLVMYGCDIAGDVHTLNLPNRATSRNHRSQRGGVPALVGVAQSTGEAIR